MFIHLTAVNTFQVHPSFFPGLVAAYQLELSAVALEEEFNFFLFTMLEKLFFTLRFPFSSRT